MKNYLLIPFKGDKCLLIESIGWTGNLSSSRVMARDMLSKNKTYDYIEIMCFDLMDTVHQPFSLGDNNEERQK